MSLKLLQNLQENNCTGVYFIDVVNGCQAINKWTNKEIYVLLFDVLMDV